MTKREQELEAQVAALRAEVASLKEQVGILLAANAQLRQELDKYKSEPPSFIKPNTPGPKDKADRQPRRKRAKEQNGARRREQNPTQTMQHRVEQCPTCHYPLQHPQLALRRQLLELPPPPTVQVIEHQLYKSWCPRCEKWHQAHVDLSNQVIGQSRMGVRIASLIAYLRTTLRMPVRLIREYLLTMHNLLISTGEIVDLLHRVGLGHSSDSSNSSWVPVRHLHLGLYPEGHLAVQHLLVGQMLGLSERLHSCLAVAVPPRVGPLLVVVAQPLVYVCLQLLDSSVHLLAERHRVELVQHGLVEPLTDAVGLRVVRLGS